MKDYVPCVEFDNNKNSNNNNNEESNNNSNNSSNNDININNININSKNIIKNNNQNYNNNRNNNSNINSINNNSYSDNKDTDILPFPSTWDKQIAEMTMDEELLLEYSCTMFKDGTYVHGRVFVTTSYLIFHSNTYTTTIPWPHINDVSHEKTSKILSDAVKLVWNDEVTFFLSLFVNFEEALRSLLAAWKSGKDSEVSLPVQFRNEIMANNHTHDEVVKCQCSEHTGREYINEMINVDVETLFQHLFSEDSDLMRWVFAQRKWDKICYTPFKYQDVHTACKCCKFALFSFSFYKNIYS